MLNGIKKGIISHFIRIVEMINLEFIKELNG